MKGQEGRNQVVLKISKYEWVKKNGLIFMPHCFSHVEQNFFFVKLGYIWFGRSLFDLQYVENVANFTMPNVVILAV